MSAGLSVEWFKDKFCQDLIERAKKEGKSFYSLLTELVEKIPVGSEKLIYLPFLMGERTPHMDPLYRGAFLGLNTVHTQAHMLRAIMEGVVFCLADCNDLLKDQGIEITSLRLRRWKHKSGIQKNAGRFVPLWYPYTGQQGRRSRFRSCDSGRRRRRNLSFCTGSL